MIYQEAGNKHCKSFNKYKVVSKRNKILFVDKYVKNDVMDVGINTSKKID